MPSWQTDSDRDASPAQHQWMQQRTDSEEEDRPSLQVGSVRQHVMDLQTSLLRLQQSQPSRASVYKSNGINPARIKDVLAKGRGLCFFMMNS